MQDWMRTKSLPLLRTIEQALKLLQRHQQHLCVLQFEHLLVQVRSNGSPMHRIKSNTATDSVPAIVARSSAVDLQCSRNLGDSCSVLRCALLCSA